MPAIEEFPDVAETSAVHEFPAIEEFPDADAAAAGGAESVSPPSSAFDSSRLGADQAALLNLQDTLRGYNPAALNPMPEPEGGALIEATETPLDKVWRLVRQSKALRPVFGDPGSSGDDFQQRGIPATLASIPARPFVGAGKGAQAVVGDVAELEQGNPTLENLSAASRGEALPVLDKIASAALEEHERGEFGVPSLLAHISLGMADLAPKLLAMQGGPAMAGSVFGTGPDNSFDVSAGAMGAVLPGISEGTRAVVADAVDAGVKRGATWLAQPAVEKTLQVAANQAAMDGVMALQQSPELLELAESDPREFKRRVAELVGSNLAFAVPEIMRQTPTQEVFEGEPQNPTGVEPLRRRDAEMTKFLNAPLPETRNVRFKAEENISSPKTLVDADKDQVGYLGIQEFPAESSPAEAVQSSDPGLVQTPSAVAATPAAPESSLVPESGTLQAIAEQKPVTAQRVARVEASKQKPLSTLAEVLGEKLDVLNKLEAELRAKESSANAPEIDSTSPAGKAGAVDIGRPVQRSAEVPETAAETLPPSTNKEVTARFPDGAVDPIATALNKMRAEGSASEPPADSVMDWLDSIKATSSEGGKNLHAFGLLPEAWNTLVDLVKLGVKGGRKLAEAVDWAFAQFKEKHPESQFQESEAKAHFLSSGKSPERERGAEQVKTEIAAAEAEASKWISAMVNAQKREGLTRSEVQQKAALAAAKQHELRDELLHHPDYIAEQLKTQHGAVTEANELLKPAGKTVHPEDFPNPHELREKLKPEQFTRYQELQRVIEESAAELNRMPKKMVGRIMAEMQADGRLPKAKPLIENPGRSLDTVTDWLRTNGVDSPRKTLAARLNLAERLADALHNGKTSAQKALFRAQSIWKAAVESYKSPPLDGDFRHVIKSWIYADQRTGLATHQFVKELTAKVPDSNRRKAMALWLDANGDASLLRFQATSVPDAYRKPFELALKLTAGEKQLAMKIKQDFAAKLDDGIKVGLIERGLEDYGVPQRWKIKPEIGTDQQAGKERKGSAGRPEAKLDPRSPFFSFQRETPSYFDGIMAKGVPESLDIAHLVAVYDAAFHKSLSSRAMIAALQEAKAADGMPVVRISGSANVSKDGGKTYFVDSKAWSKADTSVDGRPYQSLDHSALKGWKLVQKDAEGNPIIVKGDMLIHPDHVAYLKNELGQSSLREVPVVRAVMKSQAFLKASKLSASFFHLATIGEHMASHLVNPFLNGFKIDLRDPKQSLLVRNGLELGMSYPQMAYEEGLASAHSGLFNKIPGLGDLSAKATKWMFSDYIPAIMMKAGLHALENNQKRYGKELSPDQIAELTANQMNAAGGLLNYRLRGAEGNMWGRLGANKTFMDLQRLALMAPQFLEARMRVVGQALKPFGHEQRKMLLLQAGVLYVGARVLNQLFDDDPHWNDNPFSVVIKGRAYSIRTIVGDFWHMISDTRSFVAGRLSPLTRIATETVTGRDLRTGARKEPPIDTNSQISRTAQNIVVDLANWLTPITVEGMLPGAAGREQTLGSMALSSIGVGSRKFNATMQIHDLAREFNRNSSDPAARDAQKRKDGGAYAQSPYRKLDALLDAGDKEQARKEIEALKADGKTLKQILGRYSRNFYFTGSARREAEFLRSLDEKKRKIYDEAKAERARREQSLRQVLLL